MAAVCSPGPTAILPTDRLPLPSRLAVDPSISTLAGSNSTASETIWRTGVRSRAWAERGELRHAIDRRSGALSNVRPCQDRRVAPTTPQARTTFPVKRTTAW